MKGFVGMEAVSREEQGVRGDGRVEEQGVVW